MTLIQLHYLIVIAETNSLNKAAEQLYVSQPSLTSAIKELEKELGVTLLYRSGRGVTLTNDGVECFMQNSSTVSMRRFWKNMEWAAPIRRNLECPHSIILLQ